MEDFGVFTSTSSTKYVQIILGRIKEDKISCNMNFVKHDPFLNNLFLY